MLTTLRRHWKLTSLTGAVLLAGAAWLAFGYFGVQYLFIDDEVDEAVPVFAVSEEPDASEPDPTEPDTADATDVPTTTAPPGPVTLVSGTFVDRSHPTSGSAIVLGDGGDQRVLRLENLDTDNGPDLNVYLSAAPADAPEGAFDDDYVDLGDLKGNIGNQNYEIPPGIDLDRYRTVVIWCVRFSVAFGTADLTPA